MLVIDCKNMKRPIYFNRETLITMCYTPKIIVFQTGEEIWRFCSIWEKIFEWLDSKEENESILEYKRVAMIFDNRFKKQSELTNNSNKKPNKLKVFKVSEDDSLFPWWLEEISISFGVEEKVGSWIKLEEVRKMCELLRQFRETQELWETTKEETQNIAMQILEVLQEEVYNYDKNTEFFKVDIACLND